MPWLILAIMLLCCSCASSMQGMQAHVNHLVQAQAYPQALAAFDGKASQQYGVKNRLLYQLDLGMTAHVARRYDLSIPAFEKAKRIYDDLYTKSITQEIGSWLGNDYALDYRGNDNEYVLVYALQALNYAAQGNLEEALVDVRGVDQAFKLIAGRYKNRPDAYTDDGFVRLLSGILWQANGSSSGYNDAYIDFQKAMSLYQQPPEILKKHFQEAKSFMDNGYSTRTDKARLYLVEYTGQTPKRVAADLILPLGGAHVTRISVPRLLPHRKVIDTSVVTALGEEKVARETEMVADLSRTAQQALSAREGLILAKAVMRPLGKYAAGRIIEQNIRRHYGDMSGDVVALLSSIFNVATEQADLRSWQTLPGEIRMVCLELDPGEYEIKIQDLDERRVILQERSLGRVLLRKGQARFLVTRSSG